MSDQHTYDAIVIGSGISGGWAAKELCEQGLKTLVLERGRMVEHLKDYPGMNNHPWEFKHRLTLSPEDRKKFFIQSRHYYILEDNKDFYINYCDKKF